MTSAAFSSASCVASAPQPHPISSTRSPPSSASQSTMRSSFAAWAASRSGVSAFQIAEEYCIAGSSQRA